MNDSNVDPLVEATSNMLHAMLAERWLDARSYAQDISRIIATAQFDSADIANDIDEMLRHVGEGL